MDRFSRKEGQRPETATRRKTQPLALLEGFDAIYFGAVGWSTVPDHVSLWGLRLNVTQNFDQWANVRPVTFLPGVTSPLRKADDVLLDWVVVRENSEGEYAGFGGRNLSGRGVGNEVALETALFTEKGCERIMRFAFDLAGTRAVRKVSSVTKSNAQQYGMVLWDEVFARVATEYPEVETERVLVDAMSAKFVLQPEDLSVVVASNLHADILSDLGAALAGSLGLAASANLNPEGRFPSMFEPVHGSAPDIAGLGIANPIGQIASGALMLEHLGLAAAAACRQLSASPRPPGSRRVTSAAPRPPTRWSMRSSARSSSALDRQARDISSVQVARTAPVTRYSGSAFERPAASTTCTRPASNRVTLTR